MNELNVESYQEFEMRLRKLLNSFRIESDYSTNRQVGLLYRGQQSSTYALESTLERASDITSMEEYLKVCLRANPLIESELEKQFGNVKYEDLVKWTKGLSSSENNHLIWHDYLTYLRHHGFPSPLLDWTQSKFVALGFAFFDELTKKDPNEKPYRSVFVYIERPQQIKGGSIGEPEIKVIGPYIRTDKRHFLQQSNYTICFGKQRRDLKFCKYSEVKDKWGKLAQDVVYKFNIPEDERAKILRLLFSMNITPYSLMPSKENLMKTIWIKEHILHRAPAFM